MGHREALLAGARQCLQQRGYARTTARDLVAASGTNLASIGYHFGSKEALLNEAIGDAMEEWSERLGKVAFADPQARPLARLRASWGALVDGFAGQRPLLVAFVEALAQAERSPELRERLSGCYERVRRAVTELIVEAATADIADHTGELPEPTARMMATMLIAVSDGLAVQWLLDPQRMPEGAELFDAVETAIRALA